MEERTDRKARKMPRYGRDTPIDCKIYVGDLPRDASEKELERAFSYYGPLRSVWVARNPPGFAFIEYEDPRDADDSVRGMDGTSICGSRIRVERSTGKVGSKPWMRSGSSRGPPRLRKPFDPNDRCYECGGHGHYAYDCSRYGSSRGRRHSRSRSRSRSNEHRRSHSRSRSKEGRYRSRSRSRGRYGKSRSRSRDKYNRARSHSGSRSPVRASGKDRERTNRSRSRSVSRSPSRDRSQSRSKDRGTMSHNGRDGDHHDD